MEPQDFQPASHGICHVGTRRTCEDPVRGPVAVYILFQRSEERGNTLHLVQNYAVSQTGNKSR